MRNTLGRLWKFANTPVGDIFNIDNLHDIASLSKDSLEAISKFGEVLGKKEVKNNQDFAKLISQTSTLFDVLNSPWGQVISASVPFLPVATGLLKVCLDITKTEPTLSQSVALITQAAYLESLKSYLDNHPDLKEKLSNNNKDVSDFVKEEIKKLADLELDDREARLVLVSFPESRLADFFNQALSFRLEEANIEKQHTKSVVKQIASETPRYIETILAESEATTSIKQIKDWYTLGGKEVFEKYLSVDTYLEEKIATLPQDNVFDEKFTFQDIYVPLKAIPLDANGEEICNSQPFVLQDGVEERILGDKDKDKVIVIQAGPGRGKSVFCRMFADKVRQELHPRITPIFIRLRDIQHFEANFNETLKNALSNVDFVNTDAGWLTDRNTHYLFFLDGFDELSIEGRSKVSLDNFLQQIAQFQKDMTGSESGHRVILTGRTIAFQGLRLPNNLTQVKILTMDNNLQEEWLGKWQKVVNVDETIAEAKTNAFREFLRADDCPTEVKQELAVEPLLLYMLGAMHRDESIKLSDFQGNSKIQAKITIYEKAFDWVLTKQREKWLQANIIGLDEDNFEEVMESILTESAMAVVQSGGESAKLPMIEERLRKQDDDLVKIVDELREKEGDNALNTALGAFYIKATDNKEGGVEFYHKSFSEFLCAKRLYLSFEDWTTKVKVSGRKESYHINDEQLASQVYDLLGYGGLSWEIVEYLRGLLDKYSQNPPNPPWEGGNLQTINVPENEDGYFAVEKVVDLFNRLYDFYLRWCDGEFIDADGITLPQTKMRELKPYVSADANLGLRQVDVLTGLNVMILLLELHRYGIDSEDEDLKQQLNFHPCGEVDEEGKLKDKDLLLKIIGYSNCLGITGFIDTVGKFLNHANLNYANLNHANLNHANLYNANLENANLYNANLNYAYLNHAYLEDAYLEDANLNHAYLEDANLNHANLYKANLEDANLYKANLNYAYLEDANLENANLNYANLNYANLENANLYKAYLNYANLYNAYFYNANLKYANLDNISWNEDTNWDNVEGLETARNVPEELKQQLGM